MSTPADVVVRSTGSTEERLGFMTPAVPDLFCRVVVPEKAAGSVVIVPTLSAALLIWARRERRLQQRLSSWGLGVVGFEFRGFGRSFLEGAPNLTTLSEDVSAALDLAEGPTAVIGVGGGALLAVPEARRRGLPVANWGSATGFASFFDGLARYRVEKGMGVQPSAGGSTELLDRVSSDMFQDELSRLGRADLSGFSLEASTYEDLAAVVLSEADSEYSVAFPADTPADAVAQWAAIATGVS